MPAPSAKVPSYCRHKASGQAVVRLNGRDHYLGPYGSPESHEHYARLIAERQSCPTARNAVEAGSGPPRRGLPVDQRNHARLRGICPRLLHRTASPTRSSSRSAMPWPVERTLRTPPAASFGPRNLKTLRQQLIQRGLARTYINNSVNRIKRMFKWAVERGAGAADGLIMRFKRWAGLRDGRSAAKETEPIKPVPDAYVEAVLPFVAPAVAAMIRLQRLTGYEVGRSGDHAGFGYRYVGRGLGVSAK